LYVFTRARNVKAMSASAPTESLAVDLLGIDPDEPEALAALVVNHALAPARRMWSLPEPTPGDEDVVAGKPGYPDLAPEAVTPALRGLLLLAFLCPWAAGEFARDIAERPAAGLVDRSRRLAQRGSDEIASFARAVPGERRAEPTPNWADPVPWPNPDAMDALRRARTLADAAVFGGDEPWDMVVRLDTGLTRMGWATWNAIDRILREGVHRRLLWVGEVEPIEAEAFPDGEGRLFAREGGVTSVDLPESLEALVLLDLVETLARLDRRPGLCSFCGRPLLLSRSDAERASTGGLVLHGMCENKLEVTAIQAEIA
jgi:hypothetical protein